MSTRCCHKISVPLQVLSESVANALKLSVRENVKETVKFVTNFDKFFDMLNVKNLINGKHRRKDFQLPYNSISDSRLNVCQYAADSEVHLKQFLFAVAEGRFFEDGVMKRKEFSVTKMLLSQETLLGIRMTGNAISRKCHTNPFCSTFFH